MTAQEISSAATKLFAYELQIKRAVECSEGISDLVKIRMDHWKKASEFANDLKELGVTDLQPIPGPVHVP